MKKRVAILLILACCGIMAAVALAQSKVVPFKQLQQFLPKIDLSGFKKGKPQGESSTMLGMSSSEASINYEKAVSEELTQTIEVKISDTAGVPMAAMGLSMLGLTEFSNETEDGYEKSVKIHGFPGTEKVRTTSDEKSAEISLVVANRFMVTLNAYGTSEVALLRKLLDDMNLAELAKLAK
jgi:hypothetical protein